MNDKDKEAFDSWELDYFGTAKEENCPHYMIHIKKAWQAACEYKQKDLNNYIRDHGQLLIEKATLEKRLEIASNILKKCENILGTPLVISPNKDTHKEIKQALAAINGE